MRISELFAQRSATALPAGTTAGAPVPAPGPSGGAGGTRRPPISFEFFPPKSDAGADALLRTIGELKRLDPAFVSVTWGAGGSTRRKTVELVERIQGEIGLPAMAHLTCVGSSGEDLERTLDRLEASGIENVLALGGDEPPGYAPPPGALRYASELVSLIRTRWRFCVGAACHPETHPRARSPQSDLEYLRVKVDCGVDFAITNLFFDTADYLRFVDRARGVGIQVPILPGVMPVVSARGIRRMAELTGARIPQALAARLERCGEDDDRIREVGIEWATEQCAELLKQGAPGLHFYTLNRSPSTRRVHAALFPEG